MAAGKRGKHWDVLEGASEDDATGMIRGQSIEDRLEQLSRRLQTLAAAVEEEKPYNLICGIPLKDISRIHLGKSLQLLEEYQKVSGKI